MKSIIILFFVGFCSATQWQPIGPWGGLHKKLGMAPSNNDIIYGISSGWPMRIYRTVNGGDSWQRMGCFFPMALAIAVDPFNPDIVYSGGDDADRTSGQYTDSVYKSTDGGATWIGHSVASNLGFVHDLVVNPLTSSTVYAAGYIYILGDPSYYCCMSLFKSTDAGTAWETIQIESDTSDAYCLALAPSNPDIVYVGGCLGDFLSGSPTPFLKVFKSTDGGESFSDISSGLSRTDAVISLAVHPTDPNYAYLASYHGYLYRTTDGGASWTEVFSDTVNWPNQELYQVITTPADPNLVYASGGSCIYESTDCGATWDEIPSAPFGGVGYGLAVKRTDANTIYVANLSGVYKTTDGGSIWFMANDSINNFGVGSMGVAPSSPQIIYTGSYYRYKTYNSGNDWVTSCPDWRGFGAMAVHNTNPDVVFGHQEGS